MRNSVTALAFSMLASTSMLAATVSASFSVSVTVVSTCRTSLPPATSSPRTDVISNTGSNIAVDCTLPTPHNIDIGASVVPESIAANPTLDGIVTRTYRARTSNTRSADNESLPPVTDPGTVFVTISY